MDNVSKGINLYEKLNGHRKTILFVAIAATILVFLINISLGPMNYTLWDVVRTILNPNSADSVMSAVVWTERLPEACTAIFAGLALGMAGAEMQTILKNPLAEPYTLGLANAASFGAALAISFGIGGAVFGSYAATIMAFIFSAITCAAIYSVSKSKTAGRNTIILMGVALMFLFQALVSAVISFSTKESAGAIMFWTFGSLSKTEWLDIAIMAISVIAIFILFSLNMWKLTALKLGDTKAASLGIDVNKLRRMIIIGVSFVTAVAVSFTGTIGFVGLVGPHIARMLVGEDQRYFLPVSALFGAFMLCAAASLCKLNIFDTTLHVGIVTSLIGVPFFMYMIFKKRSLLE